MVKSPLTNALLRLDTDALPLLLIVMAQSEVQSRVINRLFQNHPSFG